MTDKVEVAVETREFSSLSPRYFALLTINHLKPSERKKKKESLKKMDTTFLYNVVVGVPAIPKYEK